MRPRLIGGWSAAGAAVLGIAAIIAAATVTSRRIDTSISSAGSVQQRNPQAVTPVAVTSSEAGSDSDDSDASLSPAAAAAAPAASAPSPRRRSPRIYCYTGDRAQDEAETNRRLRHGLCLKCLPNGAGASRAPFAFGSCPLHDQADSEYPRVNPYRA